MTDLFAALFSISTLQATLRLATPTALAAMAGVVSERSGVVNLGLEGMIIGGAFAAAYAAFLTGSPWIGVLAALVVGLALGGALGLFAVGFRANHVVSGIGLNMLMLGLTTWLMQVVWKTRGASPTVASLPEVSIPILKSIPILGPVLGTHTPLVYLMLLLVPVMWLWLFRSKWGLRVRVVGERPEAADTMGIAVHRTQFLCVVASGAIAALGGAHLSLGHLSWFSQNMSAGRGYMAIAALIFGRWNPLGAALAALLFALTDALQMRVQTLQMPWPSELVQMLPYLLAIAVVAGAVRRSRPPASIGRHYE